jgi:Amidohydrolase
MSRADLEQPHTPYGSVTAWSTPAVPYGRVESIVRHWEDPGRETWGGYPPTTDRRYDKVWAACQDLQMSTHTHVGPAPSEQYGQPGHLHNRGALVGCPTPVVRRVAGVFERFPKLRWGATECGAFWANDLLWLMDTRFLREHSAKKMSRLLEGELTMPPSAYFDRNCFIGAATTERRELARRNEIGVPNMLWGNDYPHPEGTWPHTREWLRRSVWDIPIEETRQILRLTAAEVYNFDLRALAALADRIGPTPQALGQDDAVSVPKWQAAREAGRHWLTGCGAFARPRYELGLGNRPGPAPRPPPGVRARRPRVGRRSPSSRP